MTAFTKLRPGEQTFDREDPRDVVAAFDLSRLSATFLNNPYPTYDALRRLDPVHKLRDGGWFLTRHADLVAVYGDPTRFSSDKQIEFGAKFGDSPLGLHHTTSLVFNDPPRHTRVRRLIAGAMTLRAVAGMEAPLTARVDRLLDCLDQRAAAPEHGPVDLIADYAALIPVDVIGALLGVPEPERGPLRDWSLAILGALEPAPSAAQLAHGNDAVTEFLAFLHALVTQRRRAPGDTADDVLTRLIAGTDTDGALTEAELLHNCIFILNAGHETTTNLIGNALFLLATHPEARAGLLADPPLIRTAVEEFLRFESSNQLGNRITTTRVTLGAHDLPEGSRLTVCIGAANRDPEAFRDPETLDIARSPNRHLAFGLGIHQCAGLTLARMEGRVAIQRFLHRFPRFDLAGAATRTGRARFRGFSAIPARLQ